LPGQWADAQSNSIAPTQFLKRSEPGNKRKMAPAAPGGEQTMVRAAPESVAPLASSEPSTDYSTKSQPDVSAPGICVSERRLPPNVYRFTPGHKPAPLDMSDFFRYELDIREL
jgi:hypothetical protein